MVDPIAEHYGVEVRRVLTGFKYIGGVIAELESENAGMISSLDSKSLTVI